MRLYYYGIDNNCGGLENYAKILLTGIRKKDPSIDITIITEYEDMAYRDYFVSLGIKIITIPYKRHIFGYYKGLKKALYNHANSDVIQLNIMSYRNSILLRAIKKSKIRTIIVGHSNGLNGSFFSKLSHILNMHKYQKLGKHVAISPEVVKYMFKYDKKPTIIPNGIDVSRYRFDNNKRIELRKKYGFSDCDIVIGQVGRLSYQKNQIFSIKIIKELNKTNSNYKMFFIGANQNSNYYKAVSKTTNCVYIGEVDNVENYYNMFDIFIMPSLFEGAPLSVLESLSNSLVTVVSQNISVQHINDNNICQLPLDVTEWVNLIKSLKPKRNINDVALFDKYSYKQQVEKQLEIIKTDAVD